ncbi:glycoside hydrolase family 26 protein [Bacillus sp. Marseille-P3661]|uniref:glycoside hydrolase family 26 protein n=1 Tax=Bacillus sp. Marseille-P3661 TaxID=1936234 RepID=UPI000C84C86A|nr:glycosyl hydrolase [Bacillus sp. Marseille-P3661]
MKKYFFWIIALCLLQYCIPTQVLGKIHSPEIMNLEAKVKAAEKSKNWNNAAIYSSKLAELYDSTEKYKKAAHFYRLSATFWEKAGHPDWGIVKVIRADHIDTEIKLLVEEPKERPAKLAKFEPMSGTYLGMFVAGKRENGRVNRVDEIYGKKHALYLTYTSWRKKYKDTNSYFPTSFAEEVKRNGGALQIGWEPSNGLDDVSDDAYVRQFAREANRAGIPIFLRYASEMNGEWVPWSRDPQKYVEKFRLIHDIMEEEAPNVAMVWSPNFLPRHNIDPYYPGDDVVDWIGFSLYTIPYSHGKEVLGGNPIDYLRPLYEKYQHKPIMISEGAVSHYSYQLQKDYSQWAAGQIGNMYGFLPKLFPNVKAITYFNLDKRTTNYDNQNNNYDLGDSQLVDDYYKRMIADEWFLSDIQKEIVEQNPSEYISLEEIKKPTTVRNCMVYVKLPLGQQPYYVAAYQGKRKLAESYSQPWEFNIDFSDVTLKQPITIIAFDKQFRRLAERDIIPLHK